jgi:ABC-2 type transport system ATP-binding protein
MMSAIEVNNLVKKFGKFIAVNDLSFSVPENKIFGLLGSNGAGKTTTINMLTGLLMQDSGQINILSMESPKDIEKIRQHIALVPQTISLYESLTIYENLEFFGALYIKNSGDLKKKIEEMIGVFELNEKRNVKIAHLSGGYQRRCSIGCALISDPKILFLDEPLTGIDIHTTEIILNFIKSIKGITIIFTTHSIKEAESVCDYVLFMDKGQKILGGTPKQLINYYSKQFGEIITIEFDSRINKDKIEEYLTKSGFNIREIKAYGNSISLISMDLGNTLVDIMSSIKSLRSSVLNIDIKKPTLEDIFNYVMEQRQ